MMNMMDMNVIATREDKIINTVFTRKYIGKIIKVNKKSIKVHITRFQKYRGFTMVANVNADQVLKFTLADENEECFLYKEKEHGYIYIAK